MGGHTHPSWGRRAVHCPGQTLERKVRRASLSKSPSHCPSDPKPTSVLFSGDILQVTYIPWGLCGVLQADVQHGIEVD